MSTWTCVFIEEQGTEGEFGPGAHGSNRAVCSFQTYEAWENQPNKPSPSAKHRSMPFKSQLCTDVLMSPILFSLAWGTDNPARCG